MEGSFLLIAILWPYLLLDNLHMKVQEDRAEVYFLSHKIYTSLYYLIFILRTLPFQQNRRLMSQKAVLCQWPPLRGLTPNLTCQSSYYLTCRTMAVTQSVLSTPRFVHHLETTFTTQRLQRSPESCLVDSVYPVNSRRRQSLVLWYQLAPPGLQMAFPGKTFRCMFSV